MIIGLGSRGTQMTTMEGASGGVQDQVTNGRGLVTMT